MAEQYMSMRSLRYFLFEVHKAGDLNRFERFQDYDEESMSILLDSIKSFADKDLYPYFKAMDENPAKMEEGVVKVHPQIEVIIKHAAELGLIGPGFDYEQGGMQLPSVMYYSLLHIMDCANNHVTGYAGLTSGAADLIVSFGTKELIDAYVPKMMSGKWMGTMALTEPQAGSSLSDITTTAYPQEDGSYLIKGQKIFISGGDHQFAENFVHLTLARIEGAPVGTKGISLFVAPKHRMKEDGTLEDNDLVTAAELEKLGQKGYVTTHLVYGENDNCKGWLVGEAHRGLKYMFQMMNEARISVGISATSMATAAYYASLQYANERPQGRPIGHSGRKNINQEPILIAKHPDVKRMLMLQKAICEGALSLVIQCSMLADLHRVEEGDAAKDALLLLELLTPIVKTYPSEMGRVSINNGLQVLGGYGFTTDFILQQYYRDIRITAIYEGTTGIQSLDLLGRKIPMQNGRAFQLFVKEMESAISDAKAHEDLQDYGMALAAKIKVTKAVIKHLSIYAKEGDYERYLADATIFMDLFCTLVLAWQWLKAGVVAKNNLVAGSGSQSTAFYEEEINTMRFYFKYELPKITGLSEVLKDPVALTLSGASAPLSDR